MNSAERTELKSFIYDAAHQAAESVSEKQIVATTHATLKALGVDVENPLDTQADFAHLRADRRDKEDTSKTVKDAAVRWSVTAAIAGFAAWMIKHPPGG